MYQISWVLERVVVVVVLVVSVRLQSVVVLLLRC